MDKVKDLSKGYLPVVYVITLFVLIGGVIYNFATTAQATAANAKALEQMPNNYVSKAEFNATIKAMTDSLSRIDSNIQSINQTLLKYNFEVK